MGVALMDSDGDGNIEIISSLQLTRVSWKMEDVKNAGRLINAAWVRGQDRKWGDIDVIVEMPAPRYYGRANQVAVLRICWQAINLMQYYQKKARSVTPIDSFLWNIKRVDGKMKGQWNDNEKLEHFKLAFPDFSAGRKKTSSWGSKDVRDAALMGYWWLTQQEINEH